MEFNIKQNSTLPLLKLQVVKNGRNDYNNFMDLLEVSAIFFSMVDIETGISKISSRPAGIVEKENVDPNAEPEYYIYYQFQNRDTNKVGRYEGEFLIKTDDGVLILPIREKLFINIQESFIADDLPYETCYTSEFPCCVNGPYTTTTTTVTGTTTTTTTIAPTPTPTSTITPTPTPTTSQNLTPTSTPTLTPTPTPTEPPLIISFTPLIIPGSIKVQFVVTLSKPLNFEYSGTGIINLTLKTGEILKLTETVIVPKGQLVGVKLVTINDSFENVLDASSEKLEHKVELPEFTEEIKKPIIGVTPTPTPTPTNTPTITPTSTLTPTPTPTKKTINKKVLYGKLPSQRILNGSKPNNFVSSEKESVIDQYFKFNSDFGFCYILVPKDFEQPRTFRNSVEGCNGFLVPFVRIEDVEITDSNSYVNTYYVYRSFVSTSSGVDIWICD